MPRRPSACHFSCQPYAPPTSRLRTAHLLYSRIFFLDQIVVSQTHLTVAGSPRVCVCDWPQHSGQGGRCLDEACQRKSFLRGRPSRLSSALHPMPVLHSPSHANATHKHGGVRCAVGDEESEVDGRIIVRRFVHERNRVPCGRPFSTCATSFLPCSPSLMSLLSHHRRQAATGGEKDDDYIAVATGAQLSSPGIPTVQDASAGCTERR